MRRRQDPPARPDADPRRPVARRPGGRPDGLETVGADERGHGARERRAVRVQGGGRQAARGELLHGRGHEVGHGAEDGAGQDVVALRNHEDGDI